MYSILIIAGRIIDIPVRTVDENGVPTCTMTIVEEQHRRERDTNKLKTYSRQYEVRAIGQEADSTFKIAKKGDIILAEGKPGLKTWIVESSGRSRGIMMCITDHVRFLDRQEAKNGTENKEQVRDTQE